MPPLSRNHRPRPPATRQQRPPRPRSTVPARRPARTAADPHAAPPSGGPVTASAADPLDPTDAAFLHPSQLLTVEVLQRPVESALGAAVGVVDEPGLGRVG